MLEFTKVFYYLTNPIGFYEHVGFLLVLPAAMVHFTYMQATR